MTEKLILWRIGFAEKEDFFHLHCPAYNRSRVSLCEAAIFLLERAWPHLRITREEVEDGEEILHPKD